MAPYNREECLQQWNKSFYRNEMNKQYRDRCRIDCLFSYRYKMEKCTFDQIPEKIDQLFKKIESIEILLLSKPPEATHEAWFNLDEICAYLPDKPARATVYSWVHQSQIPNHKTGKKLRFLKSDIDAWLTNGRRKTSQEKDCEVTQYLNKKKGMPNGK